MLQYVNVGIAMGNAPEKVKAYADDVTDPVDKDGLYNAFLKYESENSRVFNSP